jgi:hypothetical protein
VQARRGGSGHFRERRVGDIRRAGKLRGTQVCGLVAHPGNLVLRNAAEDRLCAFRHRLDDDEVAETLQQVLHEPPGIVPGLDDAVNSAENSCGIGRCHGIHDVVQQRSMGVAEKCDRELVVKAVGSGACHELVQH